MNSRLVSIRRIFTLLEDTTQERHQEKELHTVLSLIVEAQKKLNTHQTFSPEDVKWTAPSGYGSRYAPWPDGALMIDYVNIGGQIYKESDVPSVNLLGSKEFLVKDNKIWFAFIPSEVVFTCRKIPLDADGLPMVNENHIEAIVRFIIFTMDYAEYRKQKLPRLIMKDSERLKNLAFRQARGSDNMPNWVENRRANQDLSAIYSRAYTKPNVYAALNQDFVGG